MHKNSPTAKRSKWMQPYLTLCKATAETLLRKGKPYNSLKVQLRSLLRVRGSALASGGLAM